MVVFVRCFDKTFSLDATAAVGRLRRTQGAANSNLGQRWICGSIDEE
jgi:hypothetical protein